MKERRTRAVTALAMALLLGLAFVSPGAWGQFYERFPALPSQAEYHFIRVEYSDLFRSGRGRGRGFGGGFGRGWWMQDWPESEIHFAQGVRRLTKIEIGENLHLPLTDDRIFEYPWAYATQVGYWNLSDAEVDRLREYLLRGGFLVVDDFWGMNEWVVFRDSMERLFPGRPILEISTQDPMMRVLYDIGECVTVPGLRHLRVGPGGRIVAQPEATPPHWRAIYDDRGRMMVAINYNMDIGDAWEHADMPEYPAESTGLAYRFAINSILYAMTH